MNVPVGLRTRRPWFLIHSALGEVSYAWRNRALITSERTSELTYPATGVLNSFSPGREVSYPYYAWRNRTLITSERTSELAYLATVLLNLLALGERD